MRQGDPGVLRIPDDRRQGADCEGGEEKIEAGPLEFAAEPRDERKHEHDGNKLKSVREFAEESEAGEQTGRRPEPGKLRTALESQPESEHRGCPKEDRERIDRHEEIADVENRTRVEREHRPESRRRVEKAAREIVNKQAGAGAQDRTPEADPEFGRAKKRGAGPDREGDSRPLAEVGGRQALRPHPVMRLIELKIGRAEKRKADCGQAEDEEPNRSRVTHEVASSSKLG